MKRLLFSLISSPQLPICKAQNMNNVYSRATAQPAHSKGQGPEGSPLGGFYRNE